MTKKLTRKKQTADHWMNVVTGLGTKAKDKSTYNEVDWMRLDRHTQESLFAADDLGGKIAKIIPFDGTREGITWVISNGDDKTDEQNIEEKAEVVKYLDDEFERLSVWQEFFWAWTLARVNGGALVLMVVDDGMELSEPLNLDRIRKVNNLLTMERWDIVVNSGDLINDINDPMFGTPEFYEWNTANVVPEGGEVIRIHNSRVIRFDGEHLPRRLYVRNNYWHDSIYSRLNKPISKYSTSMENVGNIMQDFNQAVYKLEGLTEAVAQDETELVVSKLEFVNLMRSTQRALVLDKEDEYTNQQSAVGGIKDLVDKVQERLTAASDIPHTRLMGESPGAALGETGRSELIDYYDTVAARQEIKLRKPIQTITEVLFAQIETEVSEPDDWSFTFDPLFQQDQEAIIRTRNIQANTDQTYMNAGVYDSFEVAKSRFGTGEYSFETQLDPDRQEEKEEVNEVMRERMLANAEEGGEPGSTENENENNQEAQESENTETQE